MVERAIAAHDAAGKWLAGRRFGAGQAREPPISRSARLTPRKRAAPSISKPLL
jgi:hypothetical protein